MEEKTTKKNWLAIASFVLALIWGPLCITGIWLPLWLLSLFLAILFGIIALCKKQKAWAAILWILISLWLLIGWWMVWKKFAPPVKDFVGWVKENPEVWDDLNDWNFVSNVVGNAVNNITEKYADSSDETTPYQVWSDLWEQAKLSIIELSSNEWTLSEETNEEPVVWIANPAAEFCVAQGWESYVVEDVDWAQMWMCRLSDGSEVDEWEYYRENANLEPEIAPEETLAEATVCDEFYKSGEEIVCTEQYEPVCGDNGQTYGNSCFACIEVDSYTNGECSTAEIEPVEIEPVVEE